MDKNYEQYARNYVAGTWPLKRTSTIASDASKAQLADMESGHQKFLASLEERQRNEVVKSCERLEGIARSEEEEVERKGPGHDLDEEADEEASNVVYPRVTIQFCTQCKWMLRAAYFAQELLSTFSTSLGEVSLQPSTGGIFTVSITHQPPSTNAGPSRVQTKLLWDRKLDGGFPETKELKRRVRDVIEPGRDLGHVDRHGTFGPISKHETEDKKEGPTCEPASREVCEDCN